VDAPAISLGRDFAMALDPVLLAKELGLDPDPAQARLLTTTSRKVLVNACRQFGKSTTTAIVALHEAIYQAPAMVVVVSPSLQQSGELYKKIRGFWQKLPGAPEATKETETQIQLRNNSRLLSLPGSERTVRGYSGVTLLIVDEASRVEDDLFAAVRPMLATTNGKFIALSTPRGRRGWWHDAWMQGENWERISVKGSECPRISAEFLKEELAALGPTMFAQEYNGAFIDNEAAVFSNDLIQRAIKHDLLPFFPTT
jgi:Terminase large subunit, T4likevirus-type, N-terminal